MIFITAKGTYKTAIGRSYNGDWKLGKEGDGIYVSSIGDRYEGSGRMT